MAATTYTTTNFLNTPKGIHIGLQHVGGQIVPGAAVTTGDTIFLCKVPHGAVITDFWEYHANGATALVLDFGLKGSALVSGGGTSLSCIVSAGAIATYNRMGVGTNPGGVTVSVSDTHAIRYGIVVGTVVSGSYTASITLNWGIVYKTDQGQG